jgi:hypothetical protein
MAVDDTCFWLGRPINAMTREQLQDALIECKLALMIKNNQVIKLCHQLEIKNEISTWYSNVIDFCPLC